MSNFTKFKDLIKDKTGYCGDHLANLFDKNEGDKDKEVVLVLITFNEAKRRLVRACDGILHSIFNNTGKEIQEFVIGKTYVQERRHVKFRADKHTTWKLGGGINGRWRYYRDLGYDGLIVLTCVTRSLVPRKSRRKIKFLFEKNDSKKEFSVDQELYALALEQYLIAHYMFGDPDPRLRNRSLGTGNTADTTLVKRVYGA